MRNLRRRLSPQVIEELVGRYNTGEGTPALSREYHISKSGLLQLLRAEGVPLRRQPLASEDAKRAVRLYKSGLIVSEVVDQIGYSYGAVRKVLHESGVTMRPKGIKRRPGDRPN
jgi:hypothetical protein